MLNQGFGGAYGEGDDAAEQLEMGMNAKLEYRIKPSLGKIDTANIQDMQKGLRNEFSKKQRFFNFILGIFQRILAFMFVQIFITAFQYYNSYVRSIKFDNCFITDYFRKIERRRRKRGREFLLPLQKLEKQLLTERTRWTLLPTEKAKFSKGSLRLLMNIIMFALIFLFDRMIYEVLAIVTKHSYVVYTQKGVHDISLEVKGKGILAKLIRSILKGFHERTEIDQKFDNLRCLPYPTITPYSALIKVFGTIGLIWVLIYFEAYGLRLRSCICSFFFPKREKTRILHLYNGTLKKRAGYKRSVRHQVRRLAREKHLTMEYNTFTALRQQCPWLCGWLKFTNAGKRHCVACKDTEDKHFVPCPTPGCSFIYCESCWEDVKHHCYACTPEDPGESSLSEGMDGSDGEKDDAED